MRKVLGTLLILTAVTTVAYWANYFTGGDVRVVDARWYSAFEDAFPVSDGWMALTSLLAGIGLWSGRIWGARFGLLAGSALLFLAGMDITFNIENGLYAQLAANDAMKFELVINVWTLVLGVWVIAFCWKEAV
ncbi:MAG: hypothetical protein HY243_10835 [Proteobacteria bacterium]|nr:hypothetical protein [Pseudomonadota bacterium]